MSVEIEDGCFTIAVVLAVVFGLGFAIGAFYGADHAAVSYEQEAVAKGHARYVTDDETGDTWWEWMPP